MIGPHIATANVPNLEKEGLMKINTLGLLGFGNKADVKNDAMVGSKSGKPRRRRRRRRLRWFF